MEALVLRRQRLLALLPSMHPGEGYQGGPHMMGGNVWVPGVLSSCLVS
jgi:hypothetical protein